MTAKAFKKRYADVFNGDKFWRSIKTKPTLTYAWDNNSTYVQNPPYFEGMGQTPGALGNITGARPLGQFGDSITTDHISPAGSIKKDSPAGSYLMEHGVDAKDFNQYGTRRGNHEVMMRGTFANIRLKNEMVPGIEGGFTHHYQTDQPEPIFDVAMRYKKEHTPQILIAGKEYGTGISRDWAAKGVNLLGVKAVVCETFERIHRSNLVGMGVLPLQFKDGMTRKSLNLTGHESFDVERHRGRPESRHGHPAHHPSPRRHEREGHPDLPHRYRRGDRVLQERRRAALRAAQPRAGGLVLSSPGPRHFVALMTMRRHGVARSSHDVRVHSPLRRHGAQQCLVEPSPAQRLRGADAGGVRRAAGRLLPVAARDLQSHPLGRPVLHRRRGAGSMRCAATASPIPTSPTRIRCARRRPRATAG